MKKKITIEELEFSLPLKIQRREKKEMPCHDCKKECFHTVTYKQDLWRSDSYGDNNRKTRTYEISFRMEDDSQKILFRTNRCYNLREALLEANEKLEQMGLGEK